MTSMLLMVSFLLHIITLFAVYILFKEVQKLKKPAYIEDIDELMTAYLEELREENARLEARLSVDKAIQSKVRFKETSVLTDIEDDNSLGTKADDAVKQELPIFSDLLNKEEERYRAKEDTENIMPELPIDDAVDHFTPSLQSQILQLSEQGLAPAEIAKRLDCGETEAALVIKMHKRIIKG